MWKYLKITLLKRKATVSEDDFFELAGMWKNSDITIED